MRPLIVALALLAVFAAPAAAAPKCPTGARCGKITVPVDRAGTVPGTFGIAYATLPATGPRAGTIFFLAGGPGEAAVIYTREIAELLKPIRASFDIVLVDQRGTGRSGEIDCLEIVGDDVPARCARRMGNRRAFLTTKETALDLDDLRAALGLEQIIPLGVSYGTKVAGEYARRFPQRTQAVVLDSPVGVGPIDLLFLEGVGAAPRVLRETCAADPCAATVKDAGVSLYAGVERVRRRELPTRVVFERGYTTRGRIGEDSVFELLLEGDGDPLLRADLPAALASLSRGDGAPLARIASRRFSAFSDDTEPEEEPDEVGFSVSRYLATACLESALPWDTASAPSSRAAARRAYLQRLGQKPFAPFKPSTVWESSVFRVCQDWPATPAPEAVPDAGPDVPVLVLSGRADLRTPLELATRVAAAYPRATLLPVPHVGHSVLTTDPSGCAIAGLQAFLAATAPAPCTAGPAIAPAGYLPASARGLGAKAVAQATVAGLVREADLLRRFTGPSSRRDLPGLRGGYASATRRRLTLRKVSWFRGVTVSGTVTAQGKGRVTVRGLGGAPRTVRI